jgi:hypothetical protein
MNDRVICEICGRSSPSGAAQCTHCGCSFELSASDLGALATKTEPPVADFGFRTADIGSTTFGEAETLFLSSLSSESDAARVDYEQRRVLENDDAFYFPVGWVGCSGHLVSKRPLRLISFGSYVGPGAHIWAYYEGISMESVGKDRLNDFEILSVKDKQNTVRVLKTFLSPKWVDGEVVPRLSSLPLELKGIDLYFGIRGLLDARANEWFDFRVSK